MDFKNLLNLFIVSLATILLSSCKMTDKKVKEVTTSVPYTVAKGYFVKNTFSTDTVQCLLIRSREKLDSVLGMAAAIGKDGMPTQIDFDKEFAIACIHPETDSMVQLETSALTKTENRLTLQLSIIRGEKQSYTIVPLQLLIVEGTSPVEFRFDVKK